MNRLDQMRTFARVIETGSLSNAARGLGLSLPAVSRQLAALESDLATQLLVRTTRRLTLTETGRRYYEHCLRILREIDDTETSLRTPRGVSGAVTVSAPVTVGLSRIGPMLQSLLERHRGLRLELRLEDRMVDLIGDGVDIAFRAGMPPPDSTGVVAPIVGTWRRVVVASPKYLKKHGTPKDPAALAKHDVLVHLGPNGASTRWRFTHGSEDHTVTVDGPMRTNALYTLREGALAGLGITRLPDWLARDGIESGALRAILEEFEMPPTELAAVHRIELRDAARVRAVIEHVREAWARA